MKLFNEYKNGIELETEQMKKEVFELLDYIDCSSFESVKDYFNSHPNFEKFESIYPPTIVCFFTFEDLKLSLTYEHDSKTIKVIDLDNINNFIEVKANNGLIVQLATKTCSLDLNKKPIIRSEILSQDIERFLMNESNAFSSVLVYNSSIGINNIINCNVFFILQDKGLILEGELNIDESEEIELKNIESYQCSKEIFDLVSCYTTRTINVSDIKFIFENIIPMELGDTLSDMIEDHGFSIIENETFSMMLDMKIMK